MKFEKDLILKFNNQNKTMQKKNKTEKSIIPKR